MFEDTSFPNRQLAALVASKVFYHLEEYDDALKMALGAGQLFDLSQRTEYVEKIVAVALDKYITERTENFEAEIKQKAKVEIEPALEEVVGRMFERCKEDKLYKQGLGMALECRRLDVLKTFITQSDDIPAMLEYCQNSAMHLLQSKAFREQVLKVIIEIFKESPQEKLDYCGVAQCYFVLNDPASVAEILKELMGRAAKEGRLMAYQIAFDMVDN
jgi:26S proteasome regulatory subunit N2